MAEWRLSLKDPMQYPVADTQEQAVHAPKGFAEREREAQQVAGMAAAEGVVTFVTEAFGPAFESPEAAGEALPALAAQPWAALRPVTEAKPAPPARPINKDGRRWPEPKRSAKTLWRFSIAYWRIEGADRAPEGAARQLRRAEQGETLDAKTLRALAHQPLRAVKPQQALDIGLFEVRLPDAPHIVVPDE